MFTRRSFIIIAILIIIFTITINVSAQLEIGDIGVVTVENAELKESPRNFSKTIAMLELNIEVIIWDYNDSWYEVEAGDNFGWVKKEVIGEYSSLTAESSDNLNVGDSTTAGAIGTEKGSKVYTIADLTGFNDVIFEAYKQVSEIDFQNIDLINKKTEEYISDPYNLFMEFRKEGELGEYAPDDYEELYRLDGYFEDEINEMEIIEEYTKILHREGWKEIEKHYIGTASAVNILTDYTILDNEIVTQYVNSIGQTLAMASRKSSTYNGYRFAVLDSDKPISFSTPSGHVFISKGLIKKLEIEDELAALLAREIGLITNKIHLKKIDKDLLVKIFSFFAEAVEESESKEDYYSVVEASKEYLRCMFADVVDDVVKSILNKPSNRDKLKAEKEALLTLYQAGYNPYVLKESVVIAEELDIFPFRDDSAFVGELEQDKSPLDTALGYFELDNPTIPKIRFDRFKKIKESL